MSAPRRLWVDHVFNRTDVWPDLAVAGAGVLAVLLIGLWLFGVLLPNHGKPGPLTFEDSPPAALAWLRTGDEPEVMPEAGWDEHRVWLDENLCAPTVSWDGRGERQALARRLSDDARLCPGFGRSLARAPMAPMFGTIGSAFLSTILVLIALLIAVRISLDFFHIRLAYRRLYLSEHRTDHEEEAALLAGEGPTA